MEYELVIITGASSGLGREYARALAGCTRTMVIVARRGERLKNLASEISSTHANLVVICETCDLADSAARDQLVGRLQQMPAGRTLLINNAGLGDYGEYVNAQKERVRAMVQVNIAAVAELTHALLPRLIEDRGDVVNIASLAADIPLPDFALYAASKAFVHLSAKVCAQNFDRAVCVCLQYAPDRCTRSSGRLHCGMDRRREKLLFDVHFTPLRRWWCERAWRHSRKGALVVILR